MEILVVLMALQGISLIAWGLVGGCRLAQERAGRRRRDPSAPPQLSSADVAVLVCAHDEAKTIHVCLDSAARLVPAGQIFVGSDASTDGTADLARQRGCQVLELFPNRGKAGTLAALLDEFDICDRFAAVLILDADAEIDACFFDHALPLFDDPAVVAVAGHAVPKWPRHRLPVWSMFFVAYRTRLYRLTQALLRYGQTWKHTNVSFIVPGFSSMYRTSALPNIDVAAPGLIIEDFNMTFELHRKRLGRVAYTPRARCISQEAHGLGDYVRQVRRWYLGFWQTVRRHGLWPGLFWLSLGLFVLEMLVQSIVFLAAPAVLVWLALQPGEVLTLWLPPLGAVDVALADAVVGVLVADYGLTAVICAVERRPLLAIYGLGFALLRWIDAFLFLYTLPLAFTARSDGRWVSPARI